MLSTMTHNMYIPRGTWSSSRSPYIGTPLAHINPIIYSTRQPGLSYTQTYTTDAKADAILRALNNDITFKESPAAAYGSIRRLVPQPLSMKTMPIEKIAEAKKAGCRLARIYYPDENKENVDPNNSLDSYGSPDSSFETAYWSSSSGSSSAATSPSSSPPYTPLLTDKCILPPNSTISRARSPGRKPLQTIELDRELPKVAHDVIKELLHVIDDSSSDSLSAPPTSSPITFLSPTSIIPPKEGAEICFCLGVTTWRTPSEYDPTLEKPKGNSPSSVVYKGVTHTVSPGEDRTVLYRDLWLKWKHESGLCIREGVKAREEANARAREEIPKLLAHRKWEEELKRVEEVEEAIGRTMEEFEIEADEFFEGCDHARAWMVLEAREPEWFWNP